MNQNRLELVIVFVLGAVLLLLGERLTQEAVLLGERSRSYSARANALRTFEARDGSGQAVRVDARVKHVLLLVPPDRGQKWSNALAAAERRGFQTFVLCIDGDSDDCRSGLPQSTRSLAYVEWKYMPALISLQSKRGAAIFNSAGLVREWVSVPPSSLSEIAAWTQLLDQTP